MDFVKKLSSAYSKLGMKEAEPSKELKEACDYLHIDAHDASKAISMATLSSLLLSFLIVIAIRPSLIVSLIILSIPAAANHMFSSRFKGRYHEERIRDIGYLPDFFSILITNLKINPNLEDALIKVSRYNYGRVSKELNRVVKDIRSGKDWHAKEAFRNMMKIFHDDGVNSAANTLISSLSIRNAHKRNSMLSNSLNQMLNAMVKKTKEFSRTIYTPVLLIFGFGTIMPLIVISLIPMLGLFKSNITPTQVAAFLLFTLVAIKLVVDSLKRKSPSKFSQIKILKKEKGASPLLLAMIGLIISTPTLIYIASKFAAIEFNWLKGYQSLFGYAGLSLCLSIFYFSKSKRLVKEWKRMKEMEDNIINAFYMLSSRIGEGVSVESSIRHVANVVENKETKRIFNKIYYRINTLGQSIDEAFKELYKGKDLYSERVKSLVDLFCQTIKRHSQKASENIIEICGYYNRIKDAEYEMSNSMSKNIDMIKLTACIFSPLISALIISMHKMIAAIVSNNPNSIMPLNVMSTEDVQFIVSAYSFAITLLLADLLNFLLANNEEVSSNYNKFKAIAASFSVFTITLIISQWLILQL